MFQHTAATRPLLFHQRLARDNFILSPGKFTALEENNRYLSVLEDKYRKKNSVVVKRTKKNFKKHFERFLGKIYENNLEKILKKILDENMKINFENKVNDIQQKRIAKFF